MTKQTRCEVCQGTRLFPGNEHCTTKLKANQRLCARCQDRANQLAIENDADFASGVEMARDEFVQSAKVAADRAREERMYQQARRDQ